MGEERQVAKQPRMQENNLFVIWQTSMGKSNNRKSVNRCDLGHGQRQPASKPNIPEYSQILLRKQHSPGEDRSLVYKVSRSASG